MNNAAAALPLYVMAGTALLVLLMGTLPLRGGWRTLPLGLALAGTAATLGLTAGMWGENQQAFHGELRFDDLGLLLACAVLLATGGALMLSRGEAAGAGRRPEFVGLILMAATGMLLTVVSGDLITLFLGIELLSVSLYVLCAAQVARARSLESGLKYLITGAIGTAVLIYGFALLYGVTGTTRLAEIASRLSEDDALVTQPLLIAAIALVAVGLGFKASVVPFHMWTPDVYEGAPTPVTALMATGTKIAAIGAFLLMFTGATQQASGDWRVLIGSIAAISMVVGNIGALVQTNVKRMLAWSGIAQAGYVLIGVAVGTAAGAEALIYYLFAYVFMTLAAFAVVILREREVENGDTLPALTGYGRRCPWAGVVMTIAMLSLAGFPPLAGFVGKFLLFDAAIDAGMAWLAIVGAIASVISVVYYLRVTIVIWSHVPDAPRHERRLAVPGDIRALGITAAVLVVALAIWAEPFLDLCRSAAASLIPL
ncbi:MAG: NADH-quinone oxidoreductase subunit N [Thermoleophilia bacterium]|nr:NADH-quinone oxidoreductase subunit N [Thermoleophilia bacterium]